MRARFVLPAVGATLLTMGLFAPPSPHAQEELRALLKAREPLYAQSALAVDTSRLGIPGAVEEISRRVTSR